jgi:hypothetical protein
MPPVKTIQDEMREAHGRVEALVEGARAGDRELADEEKVEVEALVARMKALDGKRKRDEGFSSLLASVHDLKPGDAAAHGSGGGNGNAALAVRGAGSFAPAGYPRKSLGQAFVEHEVFAQIRSMPKGGTWQSPAFELNAAVTIGQLPQPPAGAYPAGLELLPFLPTPAEWYVFSLFAQGTLTGGLIQYLEETVWTNAAAAVAAGAPKPESTLTFAAKQQALVKLAHWIGCPDEFFEDVDGLRSYVDARMGQGVIDELEDQVVNGDGLTGNMLGLMNVTGMAPDVATPAGGVYAQAIAAQRAQIYSLSRLRPDAVVMSPATWVLVSGQTSDAGGYLAGPGTFAAGPESRVAGLRVVETPHIADGVAVVGAFAQGAQLFRKGGVTVQATNSHADYFVKNITAIRAEIRAALVFYRPKAFGKVTGVVVVP